MCGRYKSEERWLEYSKLAQFDWNDPPYPTENPFKVHSDAVFRRNRTPNRRRIVRHVVQYADPPADRYTQADLLRIFLEVNAAGVPQTEDHLQDVRDMLAAEVARERAQTADDATSAPAP